MASNARARRQNIHARMAVCDPDNLIHIHVRHAADLRQLVSIGDIDITERVLDHFGHLGSANIGNRDRSLTERLIDLLHLLGDLIRIGTNRAIVVYQLIDHIARDNALGSMHQVNILANLKASRFNGGTNIAIYRARRNRRLDDYDGARIAHIKDRIHGTHHIGRIDLLGVLVVRRRNSNHVQIGLGIILLELDARIQGTLERLLKTILLKGKLPGLKLGHNLLGIVHTDNVNSVRSHHQCRGKPDIPETNNAYLHCVLLTENLVIHIFIIREQARSQVMTR